MANMGYCKFENTLGDLRDCYDSLHDDVSESEARCRRQLVNLCQQIVEEFTDDEDEDEQQPRMATEKEHARLAADLAFILKK